MLFGNKQLRIEEKMIGDLHKKIKKSEGFSVEAEKNKEIYHLDTIDIVFDIVARTLVVTDKSGEVIVDIDCKFDSYSNEQKKRFSLFGALLDAARKRDDKEKLKNGISKVKAVAQSKEQQDGIVAARNARQKLKSL